MHGKYTILDNQEKDNIFNTAVRFHKNLHVHNYSTKQARKSNKRTREIITIRKYQQMSN